MYAQNIGRDTGQKQTRKTRPWVLWRPSLRCFPQGVDMYVQAFGRDQDPVRSQTSVSSSATELHVIGRISFFCAILLCSGPHTAGFSRLSVALKTRAGAEKTITRDICETSLRPRASDLPAARRTTGLVSNDTSDPNSFLHGRAGQNLSSCKRQFKKIAPSRRVVCFDRRAATELSFKVPPTRRQHGIQITGAPGAPVSGCKGSDNTRKISVQRSPGVWWQRLTHKLGGDTSERKLLPTATRHNCSKFAPSWPEKRGRCKCGCSRTATTHSSCSGAP